jgi:hypothetical protein
MLTSTKRLMLLVMGAAVLAVGPASNAAAETATCKDKPGPDCANTGGVAINQSKADPDQCRNYKNWYDQDTKDKNTTGATYDKNLAKSRGCNWAAMRVTTTNSTRTPRPKPVK